MSASASPPLKKSRKSEIALLEQISTSLDAVIGDRPLTKTPQGKKRKLAPSDASKNAAKKFLAAKTLVKNIAKACAQEHVGEKQDALLDSLVDQYKEGYPTLSKQNIIDGIARFSAQTEGASAGEEYGEDHDLKLGRIVDVVDSEMAQYYAKVEALKRSREMAANEPEPPKPSKKRKSKGPAYQHLPANLGSPNESPSKGKDPSAPKRGRGRPRGSYEKNTPENFLINEIVKRYAIEKSKCDRLPNGALEAIVEEAKSAHRMQWFNMPLTKLDKKVRFKYSKMVKGHQVAVTENKYKFIVEEVYARYARTKKANGGKLPPGTLESIVDGVKLEYSITDDDIKMSTLKVRVQTRFAKENPEFNPPHGQVKIAELSEEDRHRRQLLLNEITARYVREKEAHPKKLSDGTLDRIIEQTKTDLGITEFEVAKASIRGRINRKSYHVQTLGSESPQDAIDEPLVATINSWLSQGISVTRAQGLDLANKLLKGKNMGTDSAGNEIILDAKWWRSFLDRNKRKIVSSGND